MLQVLLPLMSVSQEERRGGMGGVGGARHKYKGLKLGFQMDA